MAYRSGKNPFMVDEEDDLFAYRNKNTSSSRNTGAYGNGDPPPYDDDGYSAQQERKQQQMQQSMNRQLEGTQRCLAGIYEAEQIGIATAEELVHQGEQLDNIEQKIDKINADTKVSQRHLNGIKSIFGGIKNWWSGEGKKDDGPALPSGPSSRDRQQLRNTISSAADRPDGASSGTHPALRLRSDDLKGFYDDDIVEFGDTSSRSRVTVRDDVASNSSVRQTASSSSSGQSDAFKEYEKNLNANLDLMSAGMSQLKHLAVGLGDEISAQNDQIEDRILKKAERADIKIRDQNRQMRQILGK